MNYRIAISKILLIGTGLSAGLFMSGCKPHDSTAPLLLLPDDLQATLWAESPMVNNPTNMDVDSRGRLWVTEAVNYRNYNNDSSEFYHHPEGDRILILEDTDDDGKADLSIVFVQDKDLVSPLGIAVIGNKVYVSCSPHLIVYTDENGDDKPDQKEIFLTGFGGVDHDHSLHALVGGPDGNLYFTTGNAGPHHVTDRSGWTLRSGSVYTGGSPYNTENAGNQKSDDGKIWVGGLTLRINPSGAGMKVLAHNFRNSYEVFVDSRGNLWQNDNDDQVVTCRTAWIMEGGNAGYFSEDGTRTWQADHRPGQDIFAAHWHQDDPGVMPAGDNTGAGAPTGILMIEGEELGEAYEGMLLSADAGRNTIFGYMPERRKSGYSLPGKVNLITSLPEDNVGYVWNDSANARDERKWFRPSDLALGTDGALFVADWYDPVVGGHQMDDTTGYGRIYRITPKHKRLKRRVVDLSTTQGQIEALSSPAINVRFDAAVRLRAAGAAVLNEVIKATTSGNNFLRDRAIWLMASLGDAGVSEVEKLLDHTDEEVRMVAYRALRQSDMPILPYAKRMADDSSSLVRREVIVSLTEASLNEKSELVLALMRRYDGGDPWYLNALKTCVAGFESQFYNELFPPHNELSPLEWSVPQTEIAWTLHPKESVPAWVTRATSESIDSAGVEQALTALAFIPDGSAALAMDQLAASRDGWIKDRAMYWLSFRQGNDWASVIDWSRIKLDVDRERQIARMKVKMDIIADGQLPLNERRWNARDVSKDPIGAQMLLGKIEQLDLPDEVWEEIRKNLLINPDIAVRGRATQLFAASDTMRSYGTRDVVSIKGETESGRIVFEQYCAACHRVSGKGSPVAPDLTNVGQKFDKEALSEAIVNPGAGIVFGYEAWTVRTKDGMSYYGFLVGETDETITVRDLAGGNHTVKTGDVASKERHQASAMPEPASLGLTARQVADVIEYLRQIR